MTLEHTRLIHINNVGLAVGSRFPCPLVWLVTLSICACVYECHGHPFVSSDRIDSARAEHERRDGLRGEPLAAGRSSETDLARDEREPCGRGRGSELTLDGPPFVCDGKSAIELTLDWYMGGGVGMGSVFTDTVLTDSGVIEPVLGETSSMSSKIRILRCSVVHRFRRLLLFISLPQHVVACMALSKVKYPRRKSSHTGHSSAGQT